LLARAGDLAILSAVRPLIDRALIVCAAMGCGRAQFTDAGAIDAGRNDAGTT
jgi:hypothetical protein